jgi:hypothetical protein
VAGTFAAAFADIAALVALFALAGLLLRFRSPRTTEIGWSAMLAWKRSTASCVTDLGEKPHA